MGRRLALSHSAGAGLLLGLLAGGHPLYVFVAGVLVGVALVYAVRALRRLVAGARFVARALERATGAGGSSADTEGGRGTREELPPASLTELERERERRIGLRQGEAAGIRAAARVERREGARRQAMSEALEEHWRDERRRSLERAGVPS